MFPYKVTCMCRWVAWWSLERKHLRQKVKTQKYIFHISSRTAQHAPAPMLIRKKADDALYFNWEITACMWMCVFVPNTRCICTVSVLYLLCMRVCTVCLCLYSICTVCLCCICSVCVCVAFAVCVCVVFAVCVLSITAVSSHFPNPSSNHSFNCRPV